MPDEFDPETAMGLMANIPAVEAAQALTLARAIGIGLGNEQMLAHAVYLTTGSARLAQKVEVQAKMTRGRNG